MLNAIAVYITNPIDNSFTKQIYSQRDKDSYKIFKPVDQLQDIEEILPTVLPQIKNYEIRHSELNNYHHYVAKPSDDNFIIAISSRQPLSEKEQKKLIRCIQHIYLRPSIVKIKLDDIIGNVAVAYTDLDLLLSKTQEHVQALKPQVFHLIEQAISRKEDIGSLSRKALNLDIDAGNFQDKTKPGCCR